MLRNGHNISATQIDVYNRAEIMQITVSRGSQRPSSFGHFAEPQEQFSVIRSNTNLSSERTISRNRITMEELDNSVKSTTSTANNTAEIQLERIPHVNENIYENTRGAFFSIDRPFLSVQPNSQLESESSNLETALENSFSHISRGIIESHIRLQTQSNLQPDTLEVAENMRRVGEALSRRVYDGSFRRIGSMELEAFRNGNVSSIPDEEYFNSEILPSILDNSGSWINNNYNPTNLRSFFDLFPLDVLDELKKLFDLNLVGVSIGNGLAFINCFAGILVNMYPIRHYITLSFFNYYHEIRRAFTHVHSNRFFSYLIREGGMYFDKMLRNIRAFSDTANLDISTARTSAAEQLTNGYDEAIRSIKLKRFYVLLFQALSLGGGLMFAKRKEILEIFSQSFNSLTLGGGVFQTLDSSIPEEVGSIVVNALVERSSIFISSLGKLMFSRSTLETIVKFFEVDC